MPDGETSQDHTSESSDDSFTQETSEIDELLEVTNIESDKMSTDNIPKESLAAPDEQTESDAEWEQIANILNEQRIQTANHYPIQYSNKNEIKTKKAVHFGPNIVMNNKSIQSNKEQIRHRGVTMIKQ